LRAALDRQKRFRFANKRQTNVSIEGQSVDSKAGALWLDRNREIDQTERERNENRFGFQDKNAELCISSTKTTQMQ
jgi:hypothetical protein